MIQRLDNVFASQFDRLPPHSVESEMCLIASMLLDKEMAATCSLIVDRGMFFQADNQILFDTIMELHRAGKPVDALIVREELSKRLLLEEIGGVQYLASIIGSVPAPAHGAHYAGIVREKALLRQLISTSNDILRDAYGAQAGDVAGDICAKAGRAIAAIQDHGYKDTIQRLDDCLMRALAERERKDIRQLRFGLDDLDDLCGGAPIGGFTIIAAAAGMGKSALCKQIALNAARAGINVGIVAAEESADKIAANYLANASGVESSAIMYNRLGSAQWAKLWDATNKLPGQRIFIDDAQRKLSAVEATARRLVKTHGCGLIIVDHLHLLDGETDENRNSEIGKISQGLKGTFKDLNVAGIAAAQVNRGWKKGEAPELSHLRDSGNLGADADLVLMLYRDDYYRWKEDPKNFIADHELKTYIIKNKAGGEGMVTLRFDGDTQRIANWMTDPF